MRSDFDDLFDQAIHDGLISHVNPMDREADRSLRNLEFNLWLNDHHPTEPLKSNYTYSKFKKYLRQKNQPEPLRRFFWYFRNSNTRLTKTLHAITNNATLSIIIGGLVLALILYWLKITKFQEIIKYANI